MNNVGSFPVYIINLPEREDRLAHSKNQFNGREEFSPNYFKACKNEVGAVGLWVTVCSVINEVYNDKCDFVIICEDDHQFTDQYSYEVLDKCISQARHIGADILIGGASAVSSLFNISDSLLWMDGFTGTQFTVIFKSFYKTLLNADFQSKDSLDYKLTELSDRILLIYPFISVQKDFGYSDVTALNHSQRRVSGLFRDASSITRYLLDKHNYYSNYRISISCQDINNLSIPLYIVNSSPNNKHFDHITRQFSDKPEFEVRYLNRGLYHGDDVSLLQNFQSIIRNGLAEEDDVIMFGRSDLQFTDSYLLETPFQDIMEAHAQGCDIFFAGVSGGFEYALPVSDRRFWINDFRSSPFVVVFRKCFHRILATDFSSEQSLEQFLSELSNNKMVAFPFLCTQHDFGIIVGEVDHNRYAGLLESMYLDSHNRLHKIKNAYDNYAAIQHEI